MGILADVLVSKGGYNPADALNAENGPRAQELAREFGVNLGGSSVMGDYATNFADQIVSSQQELIDRQKSFIQQQFKDNPFAFDEALAKQSATAEYEPYYSELLNDYLGNIGIKRESLGGEKQIMQALTTSGTGTAGKTTREYERAVSQAEQGFAGSGMFFSGIKQRALGQADVERQYGLQSQAQEIGQKQRDVGRQQTEAVEGGVLQRQNEAWKQYLLPKQMAYGREFGGANVSDYIPPEYLRYTS
jgi:hypothetical protein